MTHVFPSPTEQAPLSRSGEQTIAALRELEEKRISGLVSDHDYTSQRAEKFAALLRPMPGLWLAEIFSAAAVGLPLGALIWFFTQQEFQTFAITAIGSTWGFIFLGRMLRGKFAELRSRGRRATLVALLDNDLITASELVDYESQLALEPQDTI